MGAEISNVMVSARQGREGGAEEKHSGRIGRLDPGAHPTSASTETRPPPVPQFPQM